MWTFARVCDTFKMSYKITSTTVRYFNTVPLLRFKANLSISHRKSLLFISTEKTKETGAQSAKCEYNSSKCFSLVSRRRQRGCDLLWLNKLQRMIISYNQYYTQDLVVLCYLSAFCSYLVVLPAIHIFKIGKDCLISALLSIAVQHDLNCVRFLCWSLVVTRWKGQT